MIVAHHPRKREGSECEQQTGDNIQKPCAGDLSQPIDVHNQKSDLGV
jgi:hypothetical protein